MSPTVPTEAVIELAVYEVHDPDRYRTRQADLHAALAEFDGFVTSIGLAGRGDSSLFADVVVWRDLPAAQAAADSLPQRPELAWFHDLLGEIRLFTHVRPTDDSIHPHSLVDALAAAPLVEIAAVRPANPSGLENAHRLLHGRYLDVVEGAVGHAGLVGDGLAVDLIGWRDAAAHEQAGATLMTVPELAPMFDPANELVVFELVEPLDRSNVR
jgi:hypothetical protein